MGANLVEKPAHQVEKKETKLEWLDESLVVQLLSVQSHSQVESMPGPCRLVL